MGTRGSRLALAQVEIVRGLLVTQGIEVEPVILRTRGDTGDRNGIGVFVDALQSALFDGTVDAAVHCLKDLPTVPNPELVLAAHLQREDPSDVFIYRKDAKFASLRVGTGSARRTSQLRSKNPGWSFIPLIGNVDTRIDKVIRGELDAIVVAIAGLRRLGIWPVWPHPEIEVEILDLETMIPAPGQGVLVLETLKDGPWQSTLRQLNHARTEVTSRAERAMLNHLGGGCSLPIAGFAQSNDSLLELIGRVISPNGEHALTCSANGNPNEPEMLGHNVAAELIQLGALDLLTTGETE